MKPLKKIDLYHAGDYLCSTRQSRTLREAKYRYLQLCQINPSGVLSKRILKTPELLKAHYDRSQS